jgi:hypothetical protein
MQLDLFTVKKEAGKAATVYRFPLCRRAALIRETVSELQSRPYADGKRYWSRHVRELRKDFRAAGLRSADIDSEIRDYARAVRIESLSSRPMRVSR